MRELTLTPRDRIRDSSTKEGLILLALMMTLLFASGNAIAQPERQSDVLTKKATLIIEHADVSHVLRALSATSRIPIGFQSVEIESDVDGHYLSIRVIDGTVKDVLNQIIERDQRYKWELDAGVINVSPKSSNTTLLDVAVAYFDFDDGDAEDVPSAILNLPEVQDRLIRLNLKENKAREYDGPIRNLRRFTLHMQNATVRDILNEIVRSGYSRYWTIRVHGGNQKFLSIWL